MLKITRLLLVLAAHFSGTSLAQDLAQRGMIMMDAQNQNIFWGYGFNVIETPKAVNPSSLLLGPDSEVLKMMLPGFEPSVMPSLNPQSPLTMPPSFEKLLEFNHDPQLGGGNITGGGEGVIYYRNKLNLKDPLSKIKESCEPIGYILSDLADINNPIAETFETAASHPFLKTKFSDDELLYGARIDLNKVAPLTMARLEQRLKLWESNSPMFVGLVRSKIKELEWRVTNLPLINPLTENGDVYTQLQEIAQRQRECDRCVTPVNPKFLMNHETLASFWPGRGVIISNRGWRYAGDLSRAGLLVHESLRSFQYDDQFPLPHSHIRVLVATLLLGAPRVDEPRMLDSLLLIHSVPALGTGYGSDESRLKLACGLNEGNERWINFGVGDFNSFIVSLETLVDRFPPQAEANKLGSAPKGSFIYETGLEQQFRTALTYLQLLKKFRAEDLRAVIEGRYRPLWMELVSLDKLSRENFKSLLEQYKSLRAKVCVNPSFSTEGIKEFGFSEEMLKEMGDVRIATTDQRELFILQDFMFSVFKMLRGPVYNDRARMPHPNIYLPIEDYTPEGIYQGVAYYQEDPSAFSQFKIIIENIGDGDAGMSKVDRFYLLNNRFLKEKIDAGFPGREFLLKAYAPSGI